MATPNATEILARLFPNDDDFRQFYTAHGGPPANGNDDEVAAVINRNVLPAIRGQNEFTGRQVRTYRHHIRFLARRSPADPPTSTAPAPVAMHAATLAPLTADPALVAVLGGMARGLEGIAGALDRIATRWESDDFRLSHD